MIDKIATIQAELSLRRILVDSSILSAVSGVTIGTVLRCNPAILHDDFPPAIQAKALPMTPRDKRQRLVVTVPFLATLIGIPVWSTLKLKRQNGGRLHLGSAMINAYAVGALANLFDLVVLDYLIGVRLRPTFAMLPGTEGMEEYGDVQFHIRGFFKGLAYMVIPSLVIAWLTTRRTRAT